ncbi:MAG: hypothetical protein IT348_06080 [Candidatus Eisenbacteria bacterium]|nr:hypothetical protein [Candidatus Eisenbacteria bacterium]
MRTLTGMGAVHGRVAAAFLAAALGVTLAGCFDAPKLEDRWTRVDIAGASVQPFQSLTLGARESIAVSVDVTYRSILTGFAVADLRVLRTGNAGAMGITPTASRLPMAQSIDSLLANSETVGRATRAVTGWDHLIQRIDFSFGANIPTVIDSTGGGGGGLFLVCYLGAGEELRRLGMADSLIVTPFGSAEYMVLPVGMTLRTAP